MGEAPAERVVRLRLLMLQYGEKPFNACKLRNLIRRLRRHLPPFSGKAFARRFACANTPINQNLKDKLGFIGVLLLCRNERYSQSS